MAFYALSDPNYTNSRRYKKIMHGLTDTAHKRRLSLTLLRNVDELSNHVLTDSDMLFLISGRQKWLSETCSICEPIFDNRIIILNNCEQSSHIGKASIVSSDVHFNIQTLYRYLQSHNKTRIAMYAVNPNSSSDLFKRDVFLTCGGKEEDIFYNRKGFLHCFEQFFAQLSKYDSVICVHDYSAISLIKHLGNSQKLFITSCGETTLLRTFTPSVTHVENNYSSFGKTGFDLSHILLKNKDVNSVKIHIADKLILGETTDYLPLPEQVLPKFTDMKHSGFYFFSDPEVDEMVKVETLLDSCSEDDLLVIHSLLEQDTYAMIAEKLFLSINGVKYKLKKMFQICGVKSKDEFIEMLSKYL